MVIIESGAVFQALVFDKIRSTWGAVLDFSLETFGRSVRLHALGVTEADFGPARKLYSHRLLATRESLEVEAPVAHGGDEEASTSVLYLC